ncbi:hypothetical protein [Parendozoicomonas haliclonae]|uniref:hypothetical protein n=1 Tax=Parendozoicomonas haliclonae TaxID=1960125 RepID=UPI001055F3D2|nr:hypothetical protein [Parendozoicomonas haliclonae]
MTVQALPTWSFYQWCANTFWQSSAAHRALHDYAVEVLLNNTSEVASLRNELIKALDLGVFPYLSEDEHRKYRTWSESKRSSSEIELPPRQSPVAPLPAPDETLDHYMADLRSGIRPFAEEDYQALSMAVFDIASALARQGDDEVDAFFKPWIGRLVSRHTFDQVVIDGSDAYGKAAGLLADFSRNVRGSESSAKFLIFMDALRANPQLAHCAERILEYRKKPYPERETPMPMSVCLPRDGETLDQYIDTFTQNQRKAGLLELKSTERSHAMIHKALIKMNRAELDQFFFEFIKKDIISWAEYADEFTTTSSSNSDHVVRLYIRVHRFFRKYAEEYNTLSNLYFSTLMRALKGHPILSPIAQQIMADVKA